MKISASRGPGLSVRKSCPLFPCISYGSKGHDFYGSLYRGLPNHFVSRVEQNTIGVYASAFARRRQEGAERVAGLSGEPDLSLGEKVSDKSSLINNWLCEGAFASSGSSQGRFGCVTS